MDIAGHGKAVAVAEAIAAVIIWGGTFVATKIALQEIGPSTVVWTRFGVGLVIFGLAAGRRGELAPPRSRDWPMIALLGFIGVALHQWLQSNGLQTARATTTAWIVATTPIFIALLGWTVLGERLGPGQRLGMVLATAGVTLVIGQGRLPQSFSAGPISIGDLLILISAINWAVYTVLSRRVLATVSPARMGFYGMLTGWLFLTLWFTSSSASGSDFGDLSTRGWAAVSALGILGSGLAYVMYYDALRILPASQLGVFLNIEPLATMLLAAPLLGESISGIVLVGGGCILVGVYLVNRNPSPTISHD